MDLKTLPPEWIHKMTKFEDDILTDAARDRSLKIRYSQCPRCGGSFEEKLHPSFMFTEDEPLPRTVGRCRECGFTKDPKTGLVLDLGNPAKAEDPFPIINPSDD